MNSRIDWRKIFEDFETLEYSMAALSARTRLPETTLARFSLGVQPGPIMGPGIVAVWCHLTGKAETFLPMLPERKAVARALAAAPPAEPESPAAKLSRDIEKVLNGWVTATRRGSRG